MVRREKLEKVEMYYVKTQVRVKDGEVEQRSLPMILPHELLGALHSRSHEEFKRRVMGPSNSLGEFWENSRGSEWFESHPFRDDILRSPAESIGLRLHGDDAPAYHNSGIFVLQCCGCTTKLPSAFSRLLVMCIPSSVIIKGVTLEPLLQVLRWSFECMAAGKYPSQDHNGEDFPKTAERAKQAGLDIAGAYRFYYAQTVGDWKWLKEEFRMAQHYNATECCFKCRGRKRGGGPLNVYNFALNAGWAADEQKRTHAEFMNTPNKSELTSLLGFHHDTILLDAMHLLCLGVLQHATGGALFTVVWHYGMFATEGEGTTWKQILTKRLQVAYANFLEWCTNRSLNSSQPCFTIGRLGLTSLSSSSPIFKGKAHNTLMVLHWLTHVVTDFAEGLPADEYIQIIATMMWGYSEMMSVFNRSPQWLTDQQADELSVARNAALYCNARLAAAALEAQQKIWPMKPKHHLVDHMCREAIATRQNPCWFWTFCDEDFIGQMKKLAVRCHRTTMAERVGQRFLLRYFVRLDRLICPDKPLICPDKPTQLGRTTGHSVASVKRTYRSWPTALGLP